MGFISGCFEFYGQYYARTLLQSILEVFYLLKYQFHFIMIRWQAFRFSEIIAKKQLPANFLKQCWYNSFQFLSNLLCFSMLAYCGWYKPRRNINSLLMNIILNGIKEYHFWINHLSKPIRPNIWRIICHYTSIHIWPNVWLTYLLQIKW